MKYFVEWGYTDDYGRHGEMGTFEWFDTEEEMEAWIARKYSGNGGYFHLFRKGVGDRAKYDRMKELYKKIAEMKAEIETLRAEI